MEVYILEACADYRSELDSAPFPRGLASQCFSCSVFVDNLSEFTLCIEAGEAGVSAISSASVSFTMSATTFGRSNAGEK